MKVNLIVLIVICLFSFWLRQTALFNDHFHNEDAAGILYSADLLMKGGLPQVDTVDMKAPGAFYLVAFWWLLFGKSMYQAQLLAIIWSMLASIGVALSAYFLYQRKCYQAWQISGKSIAYLALLLYTLFSPNTDSMDINYNSWMITPYAWAIASFTWLGYQQDQGQDLQSIKGIFALMLSGFLIVISALMKHQGSFLLPVFIWYLWLRLPELSQRLKACFYVGLGMLLGFLPLFAHYAYRGYLPVILKNYFLSESGWKYVKEQQLWSDRLLGLYDGLLGIALFVGLSAWLAIYTLALFLQYERDLKKDLCLNRQQTSNGTMQTAETKLIAQDSDHAGSLVLDTSLEESIKNQLKILRFELIFLILLNLVSFAGVSVGWRFFKGYYIQLFVPLILLGLHPIFIHFIKSNLQGFKQKSWKIKASFCLAISVGFIAFSHESLELAQMRKQRKSALYLPAVQSKEIGLWIKKKSKNPEDTIWVWGRWGWPAYFYSEKRSATKYFKNLGVLTTQLTNTWKRGTKPTTFERNSPWQEAIKELEATPPKWIVVAQNEGYHQFDAFKKLLKTSYRKLSPKDMGFKGKKYYLDVYEYKEKPIKP